MSLSDSAKSFQSTLPLRGATGQMAYGQRCTNISIHAPLAGSDKHWCVCLISRIDFNPRSPCGERHFSRARLDNPVTFQSTLPLRGATNLTCTSMRVSLFQSTLPLRGATSPVRTSSSPQPFQSTLPLRGATLHSQVRQIRSKHFNPRSPCGERQTGVMVVQCSPLFQSTLPLRGATRKPEQALRKYLFQSTLPLRGATCRRCYNLE